MRGVALTVLLMSAAARAAAAAGVARAEPPEEAASSFALTEVKPGVFAAIARPADEDAVGNAGFVIGSDAVLVVDAFATPRAAEQLLAQIRQKTPKPIRWLIVTHHHLDHWGGDAVFAKAGATVVSTENARGRILSRLQQDPGRADEKALRLDPPSVTYRDALSIWLGDRRVDVFTKPGHTDGDSLVSVPDADVLFGGDLLQKGTAPNLSDADTGAWIRTLDELAPRFPSATIVPGHGGVARPLDLRGLRDFLATIRTSVAQELRDGKSGDALVQAVMPRLAPYTRWTWGDHLAGAVEHVERELRGTPNPAAQSAAPTPVP